MFNRRKNALYLSDDEKNIIIKSLLELRNELIEQGRYTDAVDDLILKMIGDDYC